MVAWLIETLARAAALLFYGAKNVIDVLGDFV